MRTLLMLLVAVMASPAAGADFIPQIQHGDKALTLNDVVSVDGANRSFWYAVYAGGYRHLNAGHIYYGPPQLQGKEMRRLNLHIASTTVREALDALVKLDGTYSWTADEDVVNFVPKKRNRRFVDPVKILDQIVPVFVVENATTGDAVQELIIQASSQGVKGLWPRQENWKFAKDDSDYETEGLFSLSLKNKTVRECLNAIVRKDPPAFWVAIPYPNQLFFGVQTSHSHGMKLRKK